MPTYRHGDEVRRGQRLEIPEPTSTTLIVVGGRLTDDGWEEGAELVHQPFLGWGVEHRIPVEGTWKPRRFTVLEEGVTLSADFIEVAMRVSQAKALEPFELREGDVLELTIESPPPRW